MDKEYTCLECGEIHTTKAHHRKYCDRCRPIVRHRQQKDWYENNDDYYKTPAKRRQAREVSRRRYDRIRKKPVPKPKKVHISHVRNDSRIPIPTHRLQGEMSTTRLETMINDILSNKRRVIGVRKQK